ncbi:MAG: DUF1553 domain-containing protein [Planctomycetaceae bacterium]|nr:DUF1553 domain-containing protein [Planctomycetaceae bacterium]
MNQDFRLPKLLASLAALLLGGQIVAFGDEGADVEIFEKRIRPVLIRHCYECHSAASADLKGGLRLDSRDFLRQGGESGPAIVPGNPQESLLLDALKHQTFEMPPDKKLPAHVVTDFNRWIELGAPDPRDNPPSADEVAELSWNTILNERREWWSLLPVNPIAPPREQNENPIDAFVASKQQAAGIASGPSAPPRVLVRRLSLVLTGLPPTPAEIEQFVEESQTDSEAAYQSLVERLIESPHFGEHWARHWMDVVRFAETHGYEWNHEVRGAWRYRDYLIRAFNNDLSYDQLVREHIAGDLLKSPRLNEQLGINESIIGTAFWRFGELGHDNCVDFPEIRFDALDNQIDTLGKAFQALTISCARCHDHKLDAISTKDYHALVGILENSSQIVHTLDSPERIADASAEIRQLKGQLRQRLAEHWLATIDSMPDTIIAALNDEPNKNELIVSAEGTPWENPAYILKQFTKTSDSEKGTPFLTAKWIWDKPNAFQNEPSSAPIYFRFTFDLQELPKKAQLFATADDQVTSHLNGQRLGNNPAWQTPAQYDLTNQLKKGRNTIAFDAANGVGPAGFIASLLLDGEEFGSNNQWKVTRNLEDGWTTQDHDDSKWTAASEMGPSSMGPWGLVKESKADGALREDIAAGWKQLAEEYQTEHQRREKLIADNHISWADFHSQKPSGWSTSGLGLADNPTPAGDFTLSEEGDSIVNAILPAGLYTNNISNRLNGSIRSPWLPTDKKFISVQVIGNRRSMIRTVVDSCGLNEFAGGGLTYLNGGQFKWKTFPTSAAPGTRSFVELTTRSDNPRWPDRPDRAGSADPNLVYDYRSSFGITRAVLHDAPGAPAPNLAPMLPMFATSSPNSEVDVATAFQSMARDAVLAWRDNRTTDADVHWLNWFLRTGLLPNTLNSGTLNSEQQQLGELLSRYRAVASSIAEPRVVAGLADQESGRGFPVLIGGDPKKHGPIVPARYLEVISGTAFETNGSGRLQLAERIASQNNPLTARVMVNRVWHHLFGNGIVATPDDFGRMGEEPTHPQLLDFLADQFVREDWSIKQLIRRIVLSKTFQQTNRPKHDAGQVDPGNRLLHHYPARRMDAETIRDTILTISGRLNPEVFGPGLHPHREKEVDYRKLFIGPLDGDGRRSIYIKVTRMEGPQFLELFDFPNRMVTRGKRDRTNVPAQALAMLNDPFVIDQARFWAEQLVKVKHESIEARIQAMFQRAIGRPPSKIELQRFVSLIRALADDPSADQVALLEDQNVWQDATHAVFNLKELIYIP